MFARKTRAERNILMNPDSDPQAVEILRERDRQHIEKYGRDGVPRFASEQISWVDPKTVVV